MLAGEVAMLAEGLTVLPGDAEATLMGVEVAGTVGPPSGCTMLIPLMLRGEAPGGEAGELPGAAAAAGGEGRGWSCRAPPVADPGSISAALRSAATPLCLLLALAGAAGFGPTTPKNWRQFDSAASTSSSLEEPLP